MAVVMVAGNQPRMPNGIFKGVRTLTANIIIEMGYAADLHREALIATGVVLFVFILLINFCSRLLKGGQAMSFKSKVKAYKNKPLSLVVKIITTMAAAVTLGVILLIVLYILVKGVPHIKAGFV